MKANDLHIGNLIEITIPAVNEHGIFQVIKRINKKAFTIENVRTHKRWSFVPNLHVGEIKIIR